MTGETHLLILPNTDHTLITGPPEIATSFVNYIRSIAAGHTED